MDWPIQGNEKKDAEGNGSPFSAPAISLPKGGGAIRGIGEKFAANPVTGTSSRTVPIAMSPGRSGFGPQLPLSYDSGAGNGSFGFGWSLSLPAITRKTDKGLPKCQDADESDVFILSGAEDLAPLLVEPAGAISAWSVASDAGYTFAALPLSPRLGLRAGIISGDEDPADPDLQTSIHSSPRVSTSTRSGFWVRII